MIKNLSASFLAIFISMNVLGILPIYISFVQNVHIKEIRKIVNTTLIVVNVSVLSITVYITFHERKTNRCIPRPQITKDKVRFSLNFFVSTGSIKKAATTAINCHKITTPSANHMQV